MAKAEKKSGNRNEIECVQRTACCASEGGKEVSGRCVLCGLHSPQLIWVNPDMTKCVTTTETRRMCTPRRVSSAGGYVPLSIRDGSPQYASAAQGSKWCSGIDNSSTAVHSEDQILELEGIPAVVVA